MMDQPAPSYHPFDQAFWARPYPGFDRLRATEPVHWCRQDNCWVVTSHAGCRTILESPDFVVSDFGASLRGLAARAGCSFDGMARVFDLIPLFHNEDSHREARRILSGALAGRLAGLRPVVADFAWRLIERSRERGRFDAVQDFAVPLPNLVMAWLVGLPDEDLPLFMATPLSSFSTLFARNVRLKTIEMADRHVREVCDHLLPLIRDRRARPRDDAISVLAAMAKEDGISDLDVATYCWILFAIGIETTVSFLGSAIATLLDHPEAAARLRAEPDLTEAAVDELLRFESPVQAVSRLARTDVTVEGTCIRAGDRVKGMLGAANRDPAAYVQPDRLDFHRRGPRSFAFGAGSHYCLGAALASLVGAVVLPMILAQPLRRAGPRGTWHCNGFIREIDHLWLDWGPTE